jgi:hypothetical protein
VAHPDAIQELAGHQNLTTTQRNMHLIPAALDDASRLLERPECIKFRGDIGTAESENTKSNVLEEIRWRRERDSNPR